MKKFLGVFFLVIGAPLYGMFSLDEITGAGSMDVCVSSSGSMSIHDAAAAGKNARILECVAWGADINARKGTRGLTPLHCAVMHNQEDTVRFLCRIEAIDINAATSTGITPLYLAVQNKNVAIARILIWAGATVDTKCGFREETPLHCAVEGNHEEMVQLLHDAGANPGLRRVARFRAVLDEDGDIILETSYGTQSAWTIARQPTIHPNIERILRGPIRITRRSFNPPPSLFS